MVPLLNQIMPAQILLISNVSDTRIIKRDYNFIDRIRRTIIHDNQFPIG